MKVLKPVVPRTQGRLQTQVDLPCIGYAAEHDESVLRTYHGHRSAARQFDPLASFTDCDPVRHAVQGHQRFEALASHQRPVEVPGELRDVECMVEMRVTDNHR
jgi:hypothetical protein